MISRRALLTASASGLAAGIAGGALSWQSLRPRPSVRLIGRDDGLIATLDTGNERVLVLAGVIDDLLWSAVPLLSPVGQTRVDVVIGTHATLSSPQAATSAWRRRAVLLSAQTDASLPPLSGDHYIVPDSLTLRLGHDAKLEVRVGGFGAANHPPFAVSIEVDGVVCSVVSEAIALRTLVAGINSLLAVPGDVDSAQVRPARSQGIVGTRGEPEGLKVPYRRLSYTNAIRFDIADSALKMRD